MGNLFVAVSIVSTHTGPVSMRQAVLFFIVWVWFVITEQCEASKSLAVPKAHSQQLIPKDGDRIVYPSTKQPESSSAGLARIIEAKNIKPHCKPKFTGAPTVEQNGLSCVHVSWKAIVESAECVIEYVLQTKSSNGEVNHTTTKLQKNIHSLVPDLEYSYKVFLRNEESGTTRFTISQYQNCDTDNRQRVLTVVTCLVLLGTLTVGLTGVTKKEKI